MTKTWPVRSCVLCEKLDLIFRMVEFEPFYSNPFVCFFETLFYHGHCFEAIQVVPEEFDDATVRRMATLVHLIQLREKDHQGWEDGAAREREAIRAFHNRRFDQLLEEK